MQKTDRGLKGASVAVLGLSYKPNVADDRESPSYAIIKELQKKGAKICAYDPYILEKSDVKTLSAAINNKVAVILATKHNQFLKLSPREMDSVEVFLDGRNALRNFSNEFTQNKILYLGLGN